MKGNVTTLLEALTHLVNRYNKNMGYRYTIYHNENMRYISVNCNPTTAIICDVRMVAEAFLKNGSGAVVVNGFMPMIEVRYENSRNFKKEVEEYKLILVGAVPMEQDNEDEGEDA